MCTKLLYKVRSLFHTKLVSTMEDDIIENSELESANISQPMIAKNDSQKVSKKNRKSDTAKLTKLPKARIKAIMKMDPDTNIISNDALFLVTKATELFLQTLAREAHTNTVRVKRKTVTKADVKTVFETLDSLCFLEGALKM